MPTRCPECGGPMAATKRSERPEEEPPAEPALTEEPPDLAAADVDPREEIAVKAATLVCSRCGNVMMVPEP